MKRNLQLAILALAVASTLVTAPSFAADITAPRGAPVATATEAASVSGAVITRNSGNTPNLSDFSAVFANHPHKVGYNSNESDGMFLDTFRPTCPSGQKATAAQFKITLRRLPLDSGNDALAFWDGPPGTAVFNTYLWAPNEPVGTVKTLTYNIASLPAVGGPVINSPSGGNGLGLLADGDFSFSVQDDTSVIDASLEYACGDSSASARKGMTWGVYPDHPVTGVATVACQGTPGANCNPYQGDTPGTAVLPVLCVRPAGQPLPQANAGHPSAQYWSGDILATSPAVSPIAMGWTSRAQVNAYCAQQFGAGWGVAEFHMGANHGWAFSGYGNVGPAGTSRFWVDINDQPNGNVWN